MLYLSVGLAVCCVESSQQTCEGSSPLVCAEAEIGRGLVAPESLTTSQGRGSQCGMQASDPRACGRVFMSSDQETR